MYHEGAVCFVEVASIRGFSKKNDYACMLQSGRVRVSHASLGSQSWVGCDQGYTGGVGGQVAENWCVGEARRGVR